MKSNRLNNILLAESTPSLLNLLQTNLTEWGYRVFSISNQEEADYLLRNKCFPQLAVLDTMTPGLDILAICKRLRNRGDNRYSYIILSSDTDHYDTIHNGFNLNADDYLVKPFNIYELRFRLNAGMRILQYQEKLCDERNNLLRVVRYDSLTKVYNRPGILSFFRKEIARSNRMGTKVSLIMLDIDGFKKINDTYGHLTGDSVIREVAKRVSETLRPYDAVGRYGGDEFIIVVPDCECDDAVQMAERIRHSVSQSPVVVQDQTHSVTISQGVAAKNGNRDGTPEKLIELADKALYKAKHKGRNCVEKAV